MGWLLLTRGQGDSIMIGDSIKITVKEVRSTDVIMRVVDGDKGDTYVVALTEILDLPNDTRIAVRDIRGSQGSIAIDAPRHIAVDREEIWKRKQQEKN